MGLKNTICALLLSLVMTPLTPTPVKAQSVHIAICKGVYKTFQLEDLPPVYNRKDYLDLSYLITDVDLENSKAIVFIKAESKVYLLGYSETINTIETNPNKAFFEYILPIEEYVGGLQIGGHNDPDYSKCFPQEKYFLNIKAGEFTKKITIILMNNNHSYFKQ